MNNRTVKKGLFPYVFIFIFIIGCLLVFNVFNTVNHELSYTEFKEYLNVLLLPTLIRFIIIQEELQRMLMQL